MMLELDDLATKSFVASAKDTFEDVAKTVVKPTNEKKYTMLNYEDIIDKMCVFVDSYVDYKKSGDDKYRGKVLQTTRTYYNSIFIEDRYRKTMTLKQMSKFSPIFLSKTKELQKVLEKYIETQDHDHELQQLLIMTNNQYKKLSKVYHDDMKIFMWLASEKSNFYEYKLDPQIKMHYYDPSTPVIHPSGLKKKGYVEPDKSYEDDTDDDNED